MNSIQALLLGILQGLTEFLPISSSGHIEIAKVLLGINAEKNLIFTIAVHGATVLATIVVFFKDIRTIIADLLKFRWNESTRYFFMIVLSMVPAVIVGLLFKKQIEEIFTGNLLFIGFNLILTAILLFSTRFVKRGEGKITFGKAFIIGIAQACSAGLRGLSRSGATISTGLFLKIDREKAAKFSFLMVLIPVIGENALDLYKGNFSHGDIGKMPLLIGFISAFVIGLFACKWMVGIVKKGKLTWFALYCLVIGLIAVVSEFL